MEQAWDVQVAESGVFRGSPLTLEGGTPAPRTIDFPGTSFLVVGPLGSFDTASIALDIRPRLPSFLQP